MLSLKQGGIKYHFWVLGVTQPVIEPRYPRPLGNIQLIMPSNPAELARQAFNKFE